MSDGKVLPNLWAHVRNGEVATLASHISGLKHAHVHFERKPKDSELYIPAARVRALIEKQKRERWSYDTLIRNLEALIEGGE